MLRDSLFKRKVSFDVRREIGVLRAHFAIVYELSFLTAEI